MKLVCCMLPFYIKGDIWYTKYSCQSCVTPPRRLGFNLCLLVGVFGTGKCLSIAHFTRRKLNVLCLSQGLVTNCLMDFHKTSCKEGPKNNPLAQSWLNGQIQELLFSVFNVAIRESPGNNAWIWNKKKIQRHIQRAGIYECAYVACLLIT